MEATMKFYWLNQKTRDEVLAMGRPQLKTLQRSIFQVESNPELLKKNCPFASLVKSDIKELREFKKKSKNGYRVFFSLLPEFSGAVLIGKSQKKSSTELAHQEVNHWIELSKKICDGEVAYSNLEVTFDFGKSFCGKNI